MGRLLKQPVHSRTIMAILVIALCSGCLGGIGGSETTTPVQTTTEQTHATGEIMEILDGSERVEAVLVNDTYTYQKGRYNESAGTAVAYIETGESSDSEGKLYRVHMNLSEESVTSIEEVDEVNVTTS